MLEVRPPVAAFAQAMETQLRAHDDRPGWKQDVLLDLFAHLTEEVCELGRALNISKPILVKLVIAQLEKVFGETLILTGAAPAEVLREAADVGNMAMMVADVAGALPPLPPAPPIQPEATRNDPTPCLWCGLPWPRCRCADLPLDIRCGRQEAMRKAGLALRVDTALGPTRPRIVCLCGSTRFWKTFQQASLAETLSGRIVLSIGAASGTDDEHFGGLPRFTYDAVKRQLDELHLRKIDLADEVLILNVDGYVGESTARELAYARSLGKLVRWWEPPAVEGLPL